MDPAALRHSTDYTNLGLPAVLGRNSQAHQNGRKYLLQERRTNVAAQHISGHHTTEILGDTAPFNSRAPRTHNEALCYTQSLCRRHISGPRRRCAGTSTPLRRTVVLRVRPNYFVSNMGTAFPNSNITYSYVSLTFASQVHHRA